MKHGSREYFDFKMAEAIKLYTTELQKVYGLPDPETCKRGVYEVSEVPEFQVNTISSDKIPEGSSIKKITFVIETYLTDNYDRHLIWVRL